MAGSTPTHQLFHHLFFFWTSDVLVGIFHPSLIQGSTCPRHTQAVHSAATCHGNVTCHTKVVDIARKVSILRAQLFVERIGEWGRSRNDKKNVYLTRFIDFNSPRLPATQSRGKTRRNVWTGVSKRSPRAKTAARTSTATSSRIPRWRIYEGK